MEVLYDLDTEARLLCEKINLKMVRASTVGAHPVFVKMIVELIHERIKADAPRRFLGTLGARTDVCPPDCCQMNARPVVA
jgi:ferrochelatase